MGANAHGAGGSAAGGKGLALPPTGEKLLAQPREAWSQSESSASPIPPAPGLSCTRALVVSSHMACLGVRKWEATHK